MTWRQFSYLEGIIPPRVTPGFAVRAGGLGRVMVAVPLLAGDMPPPLDIIPEEGLPLGLLPRPRRAAAVIGDVSRWGSMPPPDTGPLELTPAEDAGVTGGGEAMGDAL